MSLVVARFSVLFCLFSVYECIVYKDLCDYNPKLPQCQAITLDSNRLPTKLMCVPNKDCMLNDLIHPNYADCRLRERQEEKGHFLYRRCQPMVTEFVENVMETRLVGVSVGEFTCEPIIYKKSITCGEKGTRCVCDTTPEKYDKLWDFNNKCRCQWFIDFCGVKNICGNGGVCKWEPPDSIRCEGGTLNQCTADPSLCKAEGGYCVELDDIKSVWSRKNAKKGDGFSCINRKSFNRFSKRDQFCNFNRTDHILSSRQKGFQKPFNALDKCCYEYLVCIETGSKDYGGYLFKTRPCHCRTAFRKCLMDRQADVTLWPDARELLKVVEDIPDCTMDDTGKCNPLRPFTCKVGDLISPGIAHCKIDCKTGPLLPIENRSCKIRICSPVKYTEEIRIIDTMSHYESSLCKVVKGLLVDCGMENTRCVCDGKPTFRHFTDRCRCQYWPH